MGLTKLTVWTHSKTFLCCSETWLKTQFSRLGLMRQGCYAPDGIVKNCIKVRVQFHSWSNSYYACLIMQRELRSSNIQRGYRAMWKILRDKYSVVARRYVHQDYVYTLKWLSAFLFKGQSDAVNEGLKTKRCGVQAPKAITEANIHKQGYFFISYSCWTGSVHHTSSTGSKLLLAPGRLW